MSDEMDLVLSSVRALSENLHMMRSAFHHDLMEKLKSTPRYQDSKNLVPHGYKIYSQNEEDGIIHEIFNRIGYTNKVFVEFGVADGLENNTLALLFDGWKGLWIEADEAHANRIRDNLPRILESGALSVIHSHVTKDNINDLIGSKIAGGEIDLLSVDIDGNDFHVFDAIKHIHPRVVVIEYNAKFPPPLCCCMEYDEGYTWQGDNCFGASLKFLELKLYKKGYVLVGCSLTGANAFFVKRDLAAGLFLEPFTAEQHYEPPRYYLVPLSSGHRASYKTIEKMR